MKSFQFPLTKVAIGFVLGLLLAHYLQLDLAYGLVGILCLFFIYLLTYILVKNKILKPIFYGLSVLVYSLALGIFTQVLHNDILHKNHYFHKISADKQIIRLTLETKLKPNAYNHRFYAQINGLDNHKVIGKLLVSINKELYLKEPEIGTVFEVYAKLNPNSLPKNPNQFDYGKYLEKQKVYAQIYADTTNIKKLGIEKTRFYYTHKIRNTIVKNLQKSGFNADELAVLQALILGQRQDISPEIIQAYQYAGAILILSVSGLHVAYIYLFLNFIFQIIPNTHKGRLLKLVLLLISLWGFALIAGLTPAIVRAVTMFSFVSFGTFLRRNTNIVHTLLVSMLFILLCNPSFLFEVGFQLSYLALFGIVTAHPILEKLYTPKNKFTEYIWTVTIVSITAQIWVFPLSLYYFNQFPTLFVITNLLVLFPLSIFMVYGILLSGFAFIGFTNYYFSKGMEYGIKYINDVTIQVANFEGFVFTDIPFNIWLLLGWYTLIIMMYIWLKNRNYKSLVLVFSSVLLLQSIYTINRAKHNYSDEFIVFNKSRSTLLSDKRASNITFYSRDSIGKKDFLVRSYLIGNFIKSTEISSLQNFYYADNKKIMLIDSSSVFSPELTPDVLLLIGSPKVNLERLLQNYKPEIIIADASNYKSYVTQWQRTCDKHKIRFHSTYENGFYRLGD